jgi:hypothetical protein
MIRASSLLALTAAFTFFAPCTFAQAKDPKAKKATPKADTKASDKPADKAKAEDSKKSKVPDSLEGLRQYAAEKMDASQKASVAKLKSDLSSLEAKSEVTPQMIADLKTSIAQSLKGPLKPSETSASKLSNELATLVADGKLQGECLLKVQADVQALLFSTSVTEDQLNELKTSVQATAKSSSLSSPDTQSLVTAAESVAKNASKDAPADPKKDPKTGGGPSPGKAKPAR